jgi:hypothetical protein
VISDCWIGKALESNGGDQLNCLFCEDRESADLMYHVFHAFGSKRGWGRGVFDKVSTARLEKVFLPLNTVSCIRVASFVYLV